MSLIELLNDILHRELVMWNRLSVLIEALECVLYGIRRILSKGSNLIAQALSLTRRVVFLHEGPH
jgi:hypothetical protein